MSCYSDIVNGTRHYLAFLKDGRVTGWGQSSWNDFGRINVTELIGTNATQLEIVESTTTSLALLKDGSVTGYGPDFGILSNIPQTIQGNVAKIAAGYKHVLALLKDGSVTGWFGNSDSSYDYTINPPNIIQGNITGIAGGYYRSLALLKDGSVTGWGFNHIYIQDIGSIPVEIGTNAISVYAKGLDSFALLKNGNLISWGYNAYGQLDIPLQIQGNITGLALGRDHAIALLKDGSVAGWGRNYNGQTNIPAGIENKAIKVAASDRHSIALLKDGNITGWGDLIYGRSKIPSCSTNTSSSSNSSSSSARRRTPCSKRNIYTDKICYNNTLYYSITDPFFVGSMHSINGDGSELFLAGIENNNEAGKVFVYNQTFDQNGINYELNQTINLPYLS